jgi:hydrogenase nickel incorporation protein HypA/HybF
MHEAPIVKDLIRKIEAVANAEGAQAVAGVNVRLGALSSLSADSFREHFNHAALGTVAEDAALLIEVDEDPNDPLAMGVVLESVEVRVPFRERAPFREGLPSGRGDAS